MADDYATKDLKCSFCGKDQNEVRKLIAGPTAYIYDECIDLCMDIIAEETESPEDEASEPPISIISNQSFLWEVVTHYANTNVAADYTLAPDAWNGCARDADGVCGSSPARRRRWSIRSKCRSV